MDELVSTMSSVFRWPEIIVGWLSLGPDGFSRATDFQHSGKSGHQTVRIQPCAHPCVVYITGLYQEASSLKQRQHRRRGRPPL